MSLGEWIKTAGGIASAISACIALVTLIVWKPIKAKVAKKKAAIEKDKAEEAAFRKEMRDAMGDVTKRLLALEAAQDSNEKDHIRSTVFRFAAECRRGEKHSLEEYRHIPALKEKYDALLRKTGDTNGVFAADYAYIMECYHRDQQNNDFLT